jgi:hypothetical protein
MQIHELEVLGLDWALFAMRMPYLSIGKSDDSDIDLARKLINAGREHRKFLRQLTIQINMTASMAFWFEFDTYKVGVTSNSESFWNTISKNRKLNVNQFIIPDKPDSEFYVALEKMLKIINKYWMEEEPPKEILRYLIPQGVKYQRVVTITGEAYLNIVNQRKNHRLKEWRNFVVESQSLLPQILKRIMEVEDDNT